MIDYASDIVLLGMFAFIGGIMGVIFIYWAKWVDWELNNKKRETKK
jgi:hypothetical protein